MSDRLRLVFAGTPDFAVPSLRACLAADVDVVAVYTQPDRAAGRGRKLGAGAVKQAAIEAGVAIEQPESFRQPAERRRLGDYRPDLLVVVAYGLILSKAVLATPTHGCWNVHASLLPRWRGAAPIQRAILAGDTETGVALMCMEPGLDTGAVMLERRTPIGVGETSGALHDRLAVLGADMLADGLQRWLSGDLPQAIAQPTEGMTYARKLDKREARLDWSESAVALERRVRAFDPWPIAETEIAGERFRIWSALVLPAVSAAAPGSVLAITPAGLDIATADGILRILEIQRDGARRMSVRDWLNARPQLATTTHGMAG